MESTPRLERAVEDVEQWTRHQAVKRILHCLEEKKYTRSSGCHSLKYAEPSLDLSHISSVVIALYLPLISNLRMLEMVASVKRSA